MRRHSRNSSKRNLGQMIPPSLKELSFQKFIPNLLTIAALCSGLSSIRFALDSRWETAVALVFIAMVLDGMDGRVARLLNSSSRFGAELDSFADFCNFGVVPGVLVYLFSLQSLGKIGWPIALFYTICMMLRLARFNSLLDEPMGNYFTGVSAPFGALIALTPIIIFFQFEFLIDARVYGLWVFITACLLVSQFATFSLKQGKIPRPLILPLFIGVGLVVALFIAAPWLVLSLISLSYLASIPFSIHMSKKQEESKDAS